MSLFELPFRSLSEGCRVMKSMDPARVIRNCLVSSQKNQWPVVFFFYSPASPKRLDDEDFREIFYHLTDAHVEEVDENPDPIFLLANLSESQNTTANAQHVINIIMNVLNTEDNEARAYLIRPLFNRIASRDLRHVFLRMSVRGSMVRRRHIALALASANGTLFYQVKRATLLVGLERTCAILSRGDKLWSVIQPKIGVGIVIPSPTYYDSVESIPFSKCYMEYPEGEWMSLHVLVNGDRYLFDSAGGEIDIEDSTLEYLINIPDGIYLVEYASGREIEIMIVDILFDGSADFTYERRRNLMLKLPKWLVKNTVYLKDPTEAIQHIDKDGTVLLWNREGIHTFENTHYEMVLLSLNKKKKNVFRVVGGKWVETVAGAPTLGKWRIAARDGSSYYPVGLVEADSMVEKRLKEVCSSTKPYLGDEVNITIPFFVEVDIIAAGWGDYGPYVHGRISSVASQAGLKDCIAVDEIEILCGMNYDEMETV